MPSPMSKMTFLAVLGACFSLFEQLKAENKAVVISKNDKNLRVFMVKYFRQR